MNTVKISIVSVLLVLSQAAQGVKPAQAKQPAKPQSTAAQMRNALKGANAKFTGDFNRTMAEATEGEGVGAIIGLRQEGQAMVDNLYKAGGIVQTMADDLTDPLEVVLALGETNLKKAKVQSKYKKQALEVIAEVRAVAPKLVTVGIVAFLLYTYMGLPAQQATTELPKTKFEALKAWALDKCKPLVGYVAEAYVDRLTGKTPVVPGVDPIPVTIVNIPSERTWGKWLNGKMKWATSLAGYTGNTVQ